MIILGNIGIVCLEKKIDNKSKKILVFSDAHSGHPYCKNSTISISEFLKSKLNDKNHILLEEVDRNNVKLQELWPDSKHVQDLKRLYLENTEKIIPIDIRPHLREYSWELLSTDKKLGEINLLNYLSKFVDFFNNKNNYMYIKLKKLISNKLIMKSKIKKHLIFLKKKFFDFLNKNNEFLEKDMNFIYKNNIEILKFTNDFSDLIMEWYTIINLLSVKDIDKISIIHTGLFHSDKIVNLLKTEYGFNEIYSNGLNNVSNNYNNIIACTFLPQSVEKKFGFY